MSHPIEIISLSKTFVGKKRVRVEALNELNLTINKGEVFGFLGPNGAGKSTTIKILMGLISATAGTASLYGMPVEKPDSRRMVGYLPENPALYDFLTAHEYLAFVGRAFNMEVGAIASRSAEVLDLLQLSEAAGRPIRSYSKGMVQRLGLAQALLHDPDLYILDEPMSGLDPIGRALVKDIVRSLKQRGKTVFFSTHITADVEVICDRVGIILGGKLQVVDKVERIMRNGIEGYVVQINDTKGMAHMVTDFSFTEISSGLYEVYVERDRFQEFIDKINRIGLSIELIEQRRKGLEAFFLDVVSKGNACS